MKKFSLGDIDRLYELLTQLQTVSYLQGLMIEDQGEGTFGTERESMYFGAEYFLWEQQRDTVKDIERVLSKICADQHK